MKTLEPFILPSTQEAVDRGEQKHPAKVTGPSRLPYGVRSKVRTAGIPRQIEDGMGDPVTDFPSMQTVLLREWLSDPLTRWTNWFHEDDPGVEMEHDWSEIEREANPDDLDWLGGQLLLNFFPQFFRPIQNLEPETATDQQESVETSGTSPQTETEVTPESDTTQEEDTPESNSPSTPTQPSTSPSGSEKSRKQTKSSPATNSASA